MSFTLNNDSAKLMPFVMVECTVPQAEQFAKELYSADDDIDLGQLYGFTVGYAGMAWGLTS